MLDEKLMQDISERIKDNSRKIRYGLVSVSLKFHEGNLVAISHEATETTKQKEIIYECK